MLLPLLIAASIVASSSVADTTVSTGVSVTGPIVVGPLRRCCAFNNHPHVTVRHCADCAWQVPSRAATALRTAWTVCHIAAPYVEAVVLSPWEVLGLCALIVCVYDIVGPRYRYVYYDDGRMTPTFVQQWKEYCRARREHREQRGKERRRWRSRMLNRRRRFWALKDVDFVVGADTAPMVTCQRPYTDSTFQTH